MPELTLDHIQKLAANYDKAASALNEQTALLNTELEVVHKAHQRKLSARITNAAKAKQVLIEAVEANPQLFEKPRTQTFLGIKFGLKKGADSLVVPDLDKTLGKIKSLFSDQANTLIKTTEKLVDSSVKNLDEKTLKRIGVSKKEGTDGVVVKHNNTAVEKLVDAKLAEAAKAK